MSSGYKAIVRAKLVTPLDEGFPLSAQTQGHVMQYNNATILIKDEHIVEVKEGPMVLPADIETIDAGGRLVTPGLIDPHTHLIHGGSREHEVPLKLRGASYMEIYHAGGGINSTVQATRKATTADLVSAALIRLDNMLALGVTTIESKSGYGLTTDSELKMLEAAHLAASKHPMDLVHTFMGAHAVPAEYKGREHHYVKYVIRDMIPAVAQSQLAEFCDVFCEHGVFNVNETERILTAAAKHGFKLKMHADEIVSIGGAELAAKLKVQSADHLMAASDTGIAQMAMTKTMAVLLPGTSFYLGKNYAPARMMINFGVPLALASDFNPGSCPSENLQFIMNLGYIYLRMNPEEILTACTLNAAYAIGKARTRGSIQKDKVADFVVWNTDNLAYLVYRFGINHASQVWKSGQKVAEGGKTIYEKTY